MDIWIYDEPGEDGMCKFNRMASYQAIYDELKKALQAEPYQDDPGALSYNGKPLTMLDELDYFSFGGMRTDRDKGIPINTHWFACYAVEGGSEGHYIHVDFIVTQDHGEATRDLAFLGKTFLGMDHALRVAGVLTKAFYC
jgi:hypothetical protein